MSKKSHRRKYQARRPSLQVWPLAGIIGGVLLVGLAAFVFWRGQAAAPPAPEVTGAPRLKVDQEKVDLGNVQLGQTVEVTFRVSNVGDQALRFTAPPYVEVVEGC